MAAPDEPSHAVKAAAVAHGDLTTSSTYTDLGPFGRVPDTTVRVPTGFRRLVSRSGCMGTEAPTRCLAEHPIEEDRALVEARTYVGAYQPVYYALVGWPSKFLPPEPALRLMRVCSALLSAALFASGLASLRTRAGSRRLVPVAALAITPMAVVLSGSINPNGFEVAAAFSLWATALAVVDGTGLPGRRLPIRLAVSGAALAVARPTSPWLVLGILAVVGAFALDRRGARRLARDRWVRAALAVVGVATVASAVFVVVNGSMSAVISYGASTEGVFDQLLDGLERTGTWLEQAVGAPGWPGFRQPRLPAEVRVGWLGAVAVVTIAALARGSWRQRAVLTAVVGATVALPPLALVATDSQYGWQGRYILPVAVGIPILVVRILAGSGRADRPVPGDLPPLLLRLVAGGIGLGYAVTFVATTGYHLSGRNQLLPVASGAWPGPLTPVALYGVAVATGTAWAVRLAAAVGRADSIGEGATEPLA